MDTRRQGSAVHRRYKDFTGCGLALALAIILAGILPACSSESSTAASPTPTALATTSTAPSAAQRPGASGTLTKIDGNTLTLTTAQGEVIVYVGAETFIQQTRAGTLADLKDSQSLTVIGNRDDSGNITATSIIIQLQGQGTQFTPPDGAAPNLGMDDRPAQGTPPSTPPATTGPGGNLRGGMNPAFPNDGTVRGAIGTLAKIDGNTLTLTTMQGQVTVFVSSDTTVEKNTAGTLSDLREGLSLTVMGTQDAVGNIAATSIMLQSTAMSRPTSPITPGPASETNQTSIGIYTDAACTRNARNIDWGNLKAGTSSVNRKFYVKNLSSQAMTLTLSVPSTLSAGGITLTNSGPLSLSVSGSGSAVWVLTMSLALSSTAEIGEVNFDISCIGAGTDVPQFTVTIPSHVNVVVP
jgi:hypothetical protein